MTPAPIPQTAPQAMPSQMPGTPQPLQQVQAPVPQQPMMPQPVPQQAQAPLQSVAPVPAPQAGSGDGRASPRKRALKAGIVSYNGGNITFPCVVRDISDTGARIKTDKDRHPPDTFRLLIELDGLEADCEVVWRDGQQIGVRFIGQPQLGSPKRTQVIYPSEVRQNKMVRRKPVGTVG